MWALGVTLYAMVYFTVPFIHSEADLLLEMIEKEEITYPEKPKTSK